MEKNLPAAEKRPASAQPSSFALRLPGADRQLPGAGTVREAERLGRCLGGLRRSGGGENAQPCVAATLYGIEHWDIPADYLCPPIPGRADYLHHLADLLATSNGGEIPRGKGVAILDVGVGANCIYPIVGLREYGWRFTGSEIDPVSLNSAKMIVEMNPTLRNSVRLRLQNSLS